MSTSAQQAGTPSPFPGICSLHALLLSVYERMVGRASREHLSGGDPLWHTICALPVLLSIYKWVLGRASCEHLSGGDPLWHTICALPVLLSIYKRVLGRASCEHLSGGDPLWYTTCAWHALLSICKRVVGRAFREHLSGRGWGHKCAFLRFFALQGRSHFLRFLCFLRFFCASLHPLLPQFALFSFVPYMDKDLTYPVVAEEDENDDDGCPDLEDKDS